jgi:hypothetical protein
MIELKKIYKKDVPDLLNNTVFWEHEFLAISKHRLYAHFKNPNSNDDEVVLLLAYLNKELVGYMGVFIDKITLDGTVSKIGWLSTWWVHPKTKGTGIGRQILDEMYIINNGLIGISQFTTSAKRVYDKSGYFIDLKKNIGLKAVLRSNLIFIIPSLFPSLKKLKSLFIISDNLLNIFVNLKLNIQKQGLKNKLKNISIEYLTILDNETRDLINKFNKNHISIKNDAFFEWLKAYHWVQESPLLYLTDKNKYEFSIYDYSFNIYLMKIIENNNCIGFVVIQKRNNVSKLLFSYYDETKYVSEIANVIKLQVIEQN